MAFEYVAGTLKHRCDSASQQGDWHVAGSPSFCRSSNVLPQAEQVYS